MADQPMPDGTAPSGGSGDGKKRSKPEAIRIAQRDINIAERGVREAKDGGSAEAIRLAEKRLKEARAALRTIQKADAGEDRQAARREFMEDYFERLGPEAASLARRDPDLRNLFDEAIKNGWDQDKFLSELKKTDWWKDPEKGSSWREAFDMEFNNPPGVWQENLDDAKQQIRDLAKSVYDITISEDVLDKIARRFFYQGWAKGDNRGLRVWLDRQFGKQSTDPDGDGPLTGVSSGGMMLDTERELREAARGYGVFRNEDWFSKTARDVLNPDSGFNNDDAINELIAEAESLYPVFAGKLSKDRNVRDVGAGYFSQLARYLEVNDPNMIDLTDPLLQRAFTNVDDKGEPVAMPLWKFTQEIKKDDRWQSTDNAFSTYSSIGSNIARMMGFVG